MSIDISDKDRLEIWKLWLSGDSLKAIAHYGPVSSVAKVKSTLDDAAPEDVLRDPRYIHSGRFFWIAVSDFFPNEKSDGRDAFVVVKQPRKMVGDKFAKGLRAIRREVRALGGDLNLYVTEGDGDRETAEAYLRMITDQGYLGFSLDENGSVSRFEPLGADVEPEPEIASPAP